MKKTNAQNQPPNLSSGPYSTFQGATPSSSGNWGTHVMGTPAVPTSHPDNQREASQSHTHPYVQQTPTQKPSDSPKESILRALDSWSKKAEITANNVWHNLKTGPSASSAALGKMNMMARALTEGGYESLYKQSFTTYTNEKLKKSFACNLSTSTGPVAGTLYLSNAHVAFCSDRPLSVGAPSGMETWSHHKIMVPLGKIGTVNPVVMKENPPEKYIQIVTVDGHDFWFMGFVNYDKATKHISEAVSNFMVTGMAVPSASTNS
ncbi:hypothetical protein L6164_004912 [Bauhinia variegata]|uniref:Uncharacterized protein n=1 Tax=Bauhinia variegata TaxID=167791 RepID=A0ACB9PPD7_BAUVA|nr:hypothetical protein L6164_004912 [Bauhinia variegata]